MLNGKTSDDCPKVSTACNNCVLNNKTHILPWKYTNKKGVKMHTKPSRYQVNIAVVHNQATPFFGVFYHWGDFRFHVE